VKANSNQRTEKAREEPNSRAIIAPVKSIGARPDTRVRSPEAEAQA
jgi:hypothetical protein